MSRPTRRQALGLLAPAAAFSATGGKRRLNLASAIEQEIANTDSLASAFLGMMIVRTSDGKTLYQRNHDRLFVPASNAKLFTTALALLRLGPNYRFTTSVLAEAAVDANGHTAGDLVLVGRGDPSLSSRTYPYSTDPASSEPLQAIDELAEQIVKGGLRSIGGDVVGDDTRYPWAPYPGGWNISDPTWDYGAPVSALVVNDNCVALSISPGEAEGDPAGISVWPPIEYLTILSRVRTDAAAKRAIHIERQTGSSEVEAWGRIGLASTPYVEKLAVPDPAMFAAAALRDALMTRGVMVQGAAAARHRALSDLSDSPAMNSKAEPLGTELARRTSPPLIQLVQVVDKVSQNLHAELLLREVGAARRGIGTLEAGLAEMRDFLASAGITPDQAHLRDGSGLSRTALVTPEAVVKLLLYLYRSPVRDKFVGLLPTGGEDGSLRTRFRGHPEARGIHAKTGTLSDVNALSGFAESREHGVIAFSLLVNNINGESGKTLRFLDNIGLRLLV